MKILYSASVWFIGGLATLAGLGVTVHPVSAAPYADRPASILAYPYVLVDPASGTETFLHLTNASEFPADVLCFYENATGQCSGSGVPCVSNEDCAPGACVGAWSAVEFTFRLTPRQPIRWQASQGLLSLPLPGNQGVIVPVPELPFIGALRCIAVDSAGAPFGFDNLIGHAAIETYRAPDQLDVLDYNAIGLQGLTVDSDGILTIGGPTAEYLPCPEVTVVQHSFAGAQDPITTTSTLDPALVVLPCSVDYQASVPASATLTYEVYDEFEMRVMGQVALANGYLFAPLSEIGPAAFQAATRGTIAGNSRVTSDGAGILAIVLDRHRSLSDPPRFASAARNVAHQQARTEADSIVLPGAVVRTATPTSTPTVTPSATPTSTPAETPTPTPEATETVVPPGGSATTDDEGDGATPEDPVETTVISPNPGTITIVEQAPTSGEFQLIGQQVSINAPPASKQDPLVIVFLIDASAIPDGVDETAIDVFRDGVLVNPCGPSGNASPDPCIASRVMLADGDVQITVLTSMASVWTFALQGQADPCRDVARNALGLCRAFCRIEGCDSATPRNQPACERLRYRFCERTGYEPPCLTSGRVSCNVPPTLTPTPTPTQPPSSFPGSVVTHFGIATADGRPVVFENVAPDGTAIYQRSLGRGFWVVLEAQSGDDMTPPGTTGTGGVVPPSGVADVQIVAENDLGDGSLAVCDVGPGGGGVPAVDPPDFGPAAYDAINDLACRFTVAQSPLLACTTDALGNFAFVDPGTTHQYCLSVSDLLTFAEGDTRLTARVRSTSGAVGMEQSIIIRVAPTPTATPGGTGAEISAFRPVAQDGCPVCCDFSCLLTPTPTPQSDPQGRRIYSLPSGVGFKLVLEAKSGDDMSPPGTAGTGGMVPASGAADVQVEAANDLGNGSVAVCDIGPSGGGVPAVDPPDFGSAGEDAINDLACRFTATTSAASACTKDSLGNFNFLDPATTHQYCLEVSSLLQFPPGDTQLTARVRSASGAVGPEQSIVVRVSAPSGLTCPASPADCVEGFGKKTFLIRDRATGGGTIIAGFLNGPALGRADFGNPLLVDGTAYALCVYDGNDHLVGTLRVDRGGENCGSKPCWQAIGRQQSGNEGFQYRDRQRISDGVEIVKLRGGAAGGSSLLVKARSNSRRGKTAMPTGIGAALEGSASATIQLHSSDAACFSATIAGGG